MAVALVVAAGRGERLGSALPKALVSLSGRPMVQWSVLALQSVAHVERIVVALPGGELDAAPAGAIAVAGGESRSQSVRNALGAVGDGDPVIVHDAARPLAPPELFQRVLDELERCGADAVVAASPVSDTIKELEADGRTVSRTLDRSRLWAVQTPQVFRRAALERALSGASDELLAAATDDAWLIEQGGGVVHVVDAGAQNVKVTNVADLRLAELLLAEREHRQIG
jgi:2-C-methyl-D-erythritol 4-phosphate cytidylyltransferase